MNPLPPRRQARFPLWELGLLVFALASATTPTSALDATNRIIFVTLHLKGDVVTLVKAESFPGTLKPQPDSTDAEPLLISLSATQGVPSWSHAMNDPAVQRLEYEDPDHPGQLITRFVRQDDLDFVVRTPQISGARQFSVSRITQSAPALNATNRITTAVTTKLLGTFELPETVTQ